MLNWIRAKAQRAHRRRAVTRAEEHQIAVHVAFERDVRDELAAVERTAEQAYRTSAGVSGASDFEAQVADIVRPSEEDVRRRVAARWIR